MKFRLFQKPANFEQRLQESKMILDEVKMHLPALETKSVEQEVVQSQLNHCVVCISEDKYTATPWLSLLSSLWKKKKRYVLMIVPYNRRLFSDNCNN